VNALDQSPSAQPGRVWVLMSTYNGERHVGEQLRSILDQLPPQGQLCVRDDGSADRTCEIVAATGDSRVSLQRGRNLGFAASFLTLLQQVPAEAEMVMFADQDDLWLPDKIQRAWRWVRDQGGTPALYGSVQMLADEALRPLHPTHRWRSSPGFVPALGENRITGCTSALNPAALRLLQQAGVPPEVHFHDWWLYLVVSAFGRVWVDPEPTLLYRQHGANQIGHGAGWLGRHWHIVRFLWRRDWVGILLGQVTALQACYGRTLPAAAREQLERHFAFGPQGAVPRWRMVLGAGRWRDSLVHELAFRLLLLMHKLRMWPPPARRLRVKADGGRP
jgi:glycosyltransferase involved in cell wall biosynthesis